MQRAAKVALPVIEVAVKSKTGVDRVRTNALLDPGSNRTLCSLRLAHLIGADGPTVTLTLDTANWQSEQPSKEVMLDIMSVGLRKRRHLSVSALVVQRLPAALNQAVAASDEVQRWEHLRGINVARRTAIGVELLIGQDAPQALAPLEVRRGKEGAPFAVRTSLGWTINGPMGYDHLEAVTNCIEATSTADTECPAMQLVRRLWEGNLDWSLDDEEYAMSREDKGVLELWDNTINTVNGHYELPIPFRDENPALPDNVEMAKKRLQGLRRRLARDPGLRKGYTDEMQRLLVQDYAESVPLSELEGSQGTTWYIPHHPVFNPNKPEKLRIVFDCAATYRDTSLNARVLQGPDLNNKLLGVLMRFRRERIAVMADIEAMFHQVRVAPQHRDALRFLWWKDGDLMRAPRPYRMKVHLFGGVWSPSCAAYALQRTLADHGDRHPLAAETAKEGFYVDDLLFSTSSVDATAQLIQELQGLLGAGGFHLTKWVSNEREVLRSVPSEERHTAVKKVDLCSDTLPTERALGMLWDLERDQLSVRVQVQPRAMTKRGILGVVSSVYDPLGLVSPVTIRAKMIFQEECRRHTGWDTSLLNDNQKAWSIWLDELPELTKYQVPRCYKESATVPFLSCQLHHFCDASQKAYGVVSYLRMLGRAGGTSCSFVFGKAKLAPLKQLTIPRLELTAAVLAVKVDKLLHRELGIAVKPSVFWTDSTTVLQYIRNPESRFRTFIANRVTAIRDWTSGSQWRYVNTTLNPADDASRGLSAKEMTSECRWIKGPRFLQESEVNWPQAPSHVHDWACDPEVLSLATTVQRGTDAPSPQCHLLPALWKQYSSWYRLLKAVAWLRRYFAWLKDHKETDKHTAALRTQDLREASTAILRTVQRESYGAAVKTLGELPRLPKTNPLHQLEPFMGTDGLLHVGGRLDYAPLPVCSRYPILLPKDHSITELIVKEVHETLAGHSGREHTLAILRRTYWVPQCRRLLDTVIKSCVVCRRNNWTPLCQRQAPLPQDRVTPMAAPFSSTGLDCFGPFLIKLGRKRFKRWGCLFTCMATRAVHLEVLMSLDTQALLNAIVRFSARRGLPTQLRSDNGTNMTGADKELRLAQQRWERDPHARGTLLRKRIDWIFNPPRASHMGGVWERQIRTVRKVMRAVVGAQVLDDDRLHTLFCEVEDIVNSRPITSASDDPGDLEALSPLHILRPGSPVGPLLTTLVGRGDDSDPGYRRRWRHAQYLADQFWKRWLREYLPSLRRRHKALLPRRNFRVGDLVIVADETLPRRLWKLGRIVAVQPGSDGLVRQATVRTAHGRFQRPTSKLCLLELQDNASGPPP